MVYTCAIFKGGRSLEDAQREKLEVVAQKLNVHTDLKVLDVGCGWGSLAIHAAQLHGCRVVGITNSRAQAEWARTHVAAVGLTRKVDIRLLDYRDLPDGEMFDAVSSIGMSEAVGRKHLAGYFGILASHLRSGGLLLNHAISGNWTRPSTRSFAHRYIFPDGDVVGVDTTIRFMETSGIRVVHAQSIGDNYPRTLLSWLANLEAHWETAVELVGERRGRELGSSIWPERQTLLGEAA